MGKQYFKILFGDMPYRVYFADLIRICKRAKKIRPTIPSFDTLDFKRKDSAKSEKDDETQPDEASYN